MLKKILTFMGAALLFLSLTACSSNYTAFELLELSHEAMEDVDSIMVEMDMGVTIDAGGMAMTVPITANMSIDVISPTEANMSMQATMSAMGMTSNMDMYFRDGYLYVDEDGFRERAPMSVAMALEEIAGPMGIDTDLNESWIEESNVESVDDGYRLEFELNESALRNIFDMGLIHDIAGPGARLDVETVIMVIYLDEDYYQTAIQLEIEVETTFEGQDATMSIDIAIDILQHGNVTVHFPAWLDDMQGGQIAGHELLGLWDNGDGRVFLFGVGDPDAIEFREDGTVIITGGRNAGTVNWEPGSAGSITIGHADLTYRISGNTLTITDSWGDDWTFDRAGTGSSATNDNRNNNDEDWEAFIEEFEAWVEDYLGFVQRLIDDPSDTAALGTLMDMMDEADDWMDRADDVQDSLSGADLRAFHDAMDDIVDRILDALEQVGL